MAHQAVQSAHIASPVVSAPSAYVAPASTQQPKNSNTIILAIILIAIVVFCIFLFTKMNTMNKQIKELQTDRDGLVKSMKLLEAIGEKVGVRQDEHGDIQELTDETGDDEGQCEVEECDDDQCGEQCDSEAKCAARPPRGAQGGFPMPPAMFAQLFGGAGMPADVTIVQAGPVRASAAPTSSTDTTAATAAVVVEETPAKESSTEKVD